MFLIIYLNELYMFQTCVLQKYVFATGNHHHSSRGNYHHRGINNNISGQSKAKHSLHSNGNNNNSHSPSSRSQTVKRKKQCITPRGTGDCVR